MKDTVLFEARNYFWPIVIWPYYERSHTIQMIGWKNKKPHTLKNVKMAFAGTVHLTTYSLSIRHLFLGSLISMHIRKEDIEKIQFSEIDNALIEVVFKNIDLNKFMRFLLKGAPDKKILLNLKEKKDDFIEKAKMYYPTDNTSRLLM